MTILEKAARAICEKRCVRAQILDEPCFDPETGRNAPCRANEAQLTLMPGIWDGAEAAFAIFSSALLDPSDEDIAVAGMAICDEGRGLCVCLRDGRSPITCPGDACRSSIKSARACLRAAGVKITGKD